MSEEAVFHLPLMGDGRRWIMMRKLLTLSVLLVALGSLPGCIIHDPGYYPYERESYYEPYYPYYYGPYLYTPFWFGGYYYSGEYGRGGDFHGHRGFGGHGGGGHGRGHR